MVAEKGALASYAVTEPGAGSDVASISTTAKKENDAYVLNGSKMWITGAGHANWFFVLAKTDAEAGNRGMSGFIVPADAPGITIGKKERTFFNSLEVYYSWLCQKKPLALRNQRVHHDLK